MLYLYLDIRFYSQIRRVSRDFLDGLLERLELCVANANGEVLSLNSPFLFAFELDNPGTKMQAAQAATSILDELKSVNAELCGFVLALDIGEGDNPDLVVRSFRERVFPLEIGQCMVVFDAAKAQLADFLLYERRDDFTVVTDSRLSHSVSADENQDFWDRKSLLRPIMAACDAFLQGPADSAVENEALVFIAPRRYFIGKAMERCLKPLINPADYPCLRPRRSACNPYAPILAAISSTDFPVLQGRLGKAERECFSQGRNAFEYLSATPFKSVIPKEVKRQFLSFLSLYLLAFARDRVQRSLPAFIVLEDIDLMPSECLSAVSSAIASVPQQLGLMVFACGESGLDSSSWPHGPSRVVELVAPSGEEALAYARGLFPDGQGPADLDWMVSEYGDDPLAFYLSLLIGKKRVDPLWSFISGLHEELQTILYILHLASGVLSERQLFEYLSHMGIKQQTQKLAFRQLYQMGLSLSVDAPCPSRESNLDLVERILGRRTESIRADFFHFLFKLSGQRVLRNSLDLQLKSGAFGLQTKESEVQEALNHEVAIHNVELIASCRESGYFRRSNSLVARERACCERLAAYLQATNGGSLSEIKLVVDSFGLLHADEDCAFVGVKALARANHALLADRPKEGLDWAKRALIQIQGKFDPAGESSANRALGLYFAGQQEINDAIEYFNNATIIAEQNFLGFERALGYYYEAMAWFLFGNFSRCLRLLAKAEEQAIATFRLDWAIQAQFMASRVEFELGRDARAIERCSQAICLCRLAEDPLATSRLEIWLARYLCRSGGLERAAQILSAKANDREALAFGAELARAQGDYPRAMDLIEAAMAMETGAKRFHFDKPFFNNGFELAEDLVIGRQSGETAFRSYLRWLRSEILSDLKRPTDALRQLFELTRESVLSDFDPHLHAYYYSYFKTNPDQLRPGQDYQTDKATILSKAFKYLQLRASRIDTAEDKHAYMVERALNRELMECAKIYKFI